MWGLDHKCCATRCALTAWISILPETAKLMVRDLLHSSSLNQQIQIELWCKLVRDSDTCVTCTFSAHFVVHVASFCQGAYVFFTIAGNKIGSIAQGRVDHTLPTSGQLQAKVLLVRMASSGANTQGVHPWFLTYIA